MASNWFTENRGISADTLNTWGVKYIEGSDEATFVYSDGSTKLRKGLTTGERVFISPPNKGGHPLYECPDDEEYPDVILVEGETDSMILWQETDVYKVYGLPGVGTWKKEWADKFANYKHVFVVLDNVVKGSEESGGAGSVEKAWDRIRAGLGGKARRIYLPSDTKDLCEFFESYPTETFHQLIEKARPSFHYEPLDLLNPKEYNWLVQDMFCHKDKVLWMGDPNAGKSLMVQHFAVAVANGDDWWLNRRLYIDGPQRVLYVDEENPDDVAIHRLWDLGLKKENVQNIRYLSHCGIRLDDPTKLHDEVEAFAPTLVVLDSLVRMHSKDENNASEMARLFNDGIKPISNTYGAAVFYLHHTTKSATGGYGRVRGSGELIGAPDSAIDIMPVEAQDADGTQVIKLIDRKQRRKGRNKALSVRIGNKKGKVFVTNEVDPEDKDAPF